MLCVLQSIFFVVDGTIVRFVMMVWIPFGGKDTPLSSSQTIHQLSTQQWMFQGNKKMPSETI
jgi:hypothetical protein